jgi:putative glutamine amidotransferase
MPKAAAKRTLLIVLCAFIFAASIPAGGGQRFFDGATADHRETQLTVFYPSVGTIRAVAALRKMGFLEAPDLVVIGVYHERETTRYEESRKYVAENGLSWFRFHPVSAEITEDALFRRNACTPEFVKIFAGSDGIIFFGGPDIPPSTYGEKTNLLTEIEDPFRHYFELSAIFHLLGGLQDRAFKGLLETRPAFPVLGICLGCQSLNVGTGGTLIQDIWSEVYGKIHVEDILALDPQQWHNNPYIKIHPQEKLIGYNFHRIRLDGKGPFCAEMGFKTTDLPRILSSHHQALDKMGLGFWPIAFSMDGKIVEAVAHKRFPGVLGVQFHPENPRLWENDLVYRQAPGDTPFSIRSLLEGTPPSFEFNRDIWRWFSRKLKDNAGTAGLPPR